jgi:alkylation response protein AidB-like acyl-CoA dehydrogenase
VGDALTFGAGLLASEQLGVAEWCLTSTVDHLKERKQFARPVGSFQALKHRLADIWLEIVGARAAARNAADRLAASPPLPLPLPPAPSGLSAEDGSATGRGTELSGEAATAATAAAVAQAYCAEVAVHAAEECVQLHGGIGMTWEHPAHLYLKRAKADEIALGTPGDHRDALAVLADLPAPA